MLWQAGPHPPVVPQFPFRATPARFLLTVLFSVKRLTIPAAVLAVLWQIGEALVPVIAGTAIDQALDTGDATQLVLWLGVLAVNFLVLSLAFRFSAQLTARATELVQHRLRVTLSRRVLHPAGGSARAPDGGLVSTMTNDVARMGMLGLAVFPTGELAGVVFIAMSLLLIHPPLGIAVLIGAPVAVWLMGTLSGRYARASRTYQNLLADTVGQATDLVTGYRVIKGIRAEAEATRRYRTTSAETLDGAYRSVGVLGRFLAGSDTVSGVFIAAVASLAGWYAIEGQLSVGGLIAAVGLSLVLLQPMQMLTGSAVPIWAAAVASSGRILDLLTDAPGPGSGEPSDSLSGAATAPSVEVSIPAHGMLRVVQVKPGELVGVHADDRTAADLVDTFLHPSSVAVSVRIDGTPAAQIDPAVYRARVVVAPHHVTLFSGTITENLTTPGARPALRDTALSAAACEDFLTGAGGLDGQIGEMGGRLSGGQRQRLALARALATDAPVLVLHDPTTAVDSVTETTIASRLRQIRQGRSTILIASSPALMGVCDRIIDLRDRDAHDQEGDMS